MSHDSILMDAERHKRAFDKYEQIKDRGFPSNLREYHEDWFDAFCSVVNDEGALRNFINKCDNLLQNLTSEWIIDDASTGRKVRRRTTRSSLPSSLMARLDLLTVAGLRRESTRSV